MSARTLVTPALPYANGPIHLGHLVEHVQVNIYVRALRMAGDDVLNVCGADTHGTPIELNAMKQGVAPEDFVARFQKEHEETFRRFMIEFDGGYGTTHTPLNEKHAGLIYQSLKDAGLTFKKPVEQFYDPEAERFLPDRFVKGTCPNPACGAEDQYGDVCEVCNRTHTPTDLINPKSAITGATPERRESEHVFVKLGAFTEHLEAWTSQDGAVAAPVRNFLKDWLKELKDWDISRDGPYFGFQIPGEDNKYFYVWLDAPIGYIALTEKAGAERGLSWEDYWKNPECKIVHLIGKDIVYFHTLFWPAMLKSAGYTLPSRVNVHGFLMVDGEKMSKSRGTFVNGDAYYDALGDVGAQALRYYFACKLNDGIDDIDLNLEDFTNRVNADLVNKVINLVSRTVPMLHRNHEGKASGPDEGASAMLDKVKDLAKDIEADYRAFNTAKVVRDVVMMADEGNRYLQEQKPWDTVKTDPALAQKQLSTALWIGKVCMAALAPIIPAASAEAARILKVDDGFSFATMLDPLATDVALEEYAHLFKRLQLKDVRKVFGGDEAAKPNEKKADKKPKPKKSKAPPAPPKEIAFDDFLKVELRAALVEDAEDVAESTKLIKTQLDLGPLGKRQVMTGLRPHVSAADLKGKMVVVVANLAPRKMKLGISEGMILSAGDDNPKPLSAEGAKPGDPIS